MAMSSTTKCMPHKELLNPSSSLVKPTPINIPLSCFFNYNIATNNISHGTNYVTLRRKPCYNKFLARSSSDDGASETKATTTATEEGWEGEDSSAVELPRGTPSLISALNVQKALRGIAITDVDHYARLGLRRGCSYDQVGDAYQNKVQELSSQGLDEEEFNKERELLKESYNILSSEEERRLYDWSLGRTDAPERYLWPFEADITQTQDFGTPTPREPEDVGPTTIVGYFILGWLVLSIALSIALNVR